MFRPKATIALLTQSIKQCTSKHELMHLDICIPSSKLSNKIMVEIESLQHSPYELLGDNEKLHSVDIKRLPLMKSRSSETLSSAL